MINLPLTPRLLNIVSYINGDKIADIGTDHAYVPLYIVSNGKCKKAIASDVRTGPVEIARANIKKHGFEDFIEVRMGSGLSVLSPGEADDIIIAGMGGELICEIIKADEAVARSARLILQPMNSQYELRHYLFENGFVIENEDISVEGFKVYNLIIAKEGKGMQFERDIFYHLPPYLKSCAYYKALYDKKERELVRVIEGLENSKEPDVDKLEKYRAWLHDLREYC